jgi:hypothetical protein
MSRAISLENLNSTQKNIDSMAFLDLPLDEQNTVEKTKSHLHLSDSTKKAIGAVRASGGDITDNDIILAAKIDRGEITTNQAIQMVISQYVA